MQAQAPGFKKSSLTLSYFHITKTKLIKFLFLSYHFILNYSDPIFLVNDHPCFKLKDQDYFYVTEDGHF